MTTSFTLTGNLLDAAGADATLTSATLGTNLGDVALVDLDGGATLLPARSTIPLTSGAFSLSLIGTNSTGTNIPDGSLRYIVYIEYRDGLGKRRSWNSGYFELTANTDLADVTGTDVAVEVDAAAAMVTALAEQAIEDYMPGISHDAVKRSTSFTTTNTTSTSTAGDIPLFIHTVTGTGRPIELKFHCPAAWHSTASQLTSVAIVCNGNINDANSQRGGAVSPSASIGPSVDVVHTTDPLTDGVVYTFTVRVYNAVAGTNSSTWFANSAYKIEFSWTSQ